MTMSEQSQEESRPIEGYVAKFDRIGQDGIQITRDVKLPDSHAQVSYVYGVDLAAQLSSDTHVEAVFEPVFNFADRLVGYSLISIKRRTRNGKSY